MLTRIGLFLTSASKECVSSVRRLNLSVPGDTALHQFLRSNPARHTLQDFMASYTDSQLGIMAKTINDEGKLPAHIVKELKISTAEKKALYQCLSTHMLPSDIAPLSTLLDTQAILNHYTSQPVEIKFSLKIACEAANRTRGLIVASESHPQVNSFTRAELIRLNRRISKMRNEQMYSIAEQAQKAESCGIGNCEEFANSVVTRIRQVAPYLHAEMYAVLKPYCDHVIVGLGNKSAQIYCDAWIGRVYLASELPQYYCDFQTFDPPLPWKVLTRFNPNYHHLEVYKREKPSFVSMFKKVLELANQNENDELDALSQHLCPS